MLKVCLVHMSKILRVIAGADMTEDSFLHDEQANAPSAEVIRELQERLSEAAIKCSERCLYQSAKW